ncbi:MAG TPA: LysM peptidoglycan-binding domain-containing protein [Anaerolineales bacterium]|nr:LysM peptidoglycan-binding domain-containing protein [Anaerolineales bacterium]
MMIRDTRNWKRLFYYLSINVLVSACTVLAVLTIWDRARPPETSNPETVAQSSESSTPGVEALASSDNSGNAENPASAPTALAEEPTNPPPAVPPRTGTKYTVQAGDTLGKIATRFDLSVEELIQANELDDPNRLDVGQVLIIPGVPEEAPTQPAAPAEATEAPPSSTGNPPEAAGNPEVTIDSVIGAGDLNSERVLLKRTGSGELSLAGWQLLEEDGEVFTFPELTLYEDGAVNLYTRSGQPTVVDLYWGLDTPVWRPGETVVLLDGNGDVRATYRVP